MLASILSVESTVSFDNDQMIYTNAWLFWNSNPSSFVANGANFDTAVIACTLAVAGGPASPRLLQAQSFQNEQSLRCFPQGLRWNRGRKVARESEITSFMKASQQPL